MKNIFCIEEEVTNGKNSKNKLVIMIPELAIVIPCYNEQEVLAETVKRMSQKIASMVAKGLILESSKIYFIDDGSKDQTWSIIEEFCNVYTCVKGIKLSRNRGHQNALMAGLLNAEGDVIVSIDADLQDDVDAIEEMVEKYIEGNEIVYGVRSKRDTDTKFKKWSAELEYR
jgi:glycosyltransferase involved in cell wall biosynthesis